MTMYSEWRWKGYREMCCNVHNEEYQKVHEAERDIRTWQTPFKYLVVDATGKLKLLWELKMANF